MIDLPAALGNSGPTTTTVLTLLLSETTPIALASLFILAPVVLALYVPILFLSRPKASNTAKLVALGLSLLPIWFSTGWEKELGWMKFAWVVPTFFYLPLGIALVNLARGALKDPPKE
ncbi:MAG: hypothetical protein H7Z21_16245 [Hymenobacter sp.]|nr:hypothetical protein [Hymenobacter sp.]